MIGVVNAAMFGHPSEPGEHVDWSTPDVFTPEELADLVGSDPATYAEESPHMIVFEVEDALGVLAEFDAFAAECEASGYTDTGDAWRHLHALADALRAES